MFPVLPCPGALCDEFFDGGVYFFAAGDIAHIALLSNVFLTNMLLFIRIYRRSLGDAVAHTAGVISDPEFTERELDPETDKFVIVATDGL